ncbi:MAG: DUF4424 family protein [Armatimonadetes bacterium]|nr:DUF4424 family protein [Armatimonadota bacterium]
MAPVLWILAAWNDGAVVGVGGTVTALDEGTRVRMASELVTIDYAKRKVSTDFVFRNDGEATTVLMGFPEEGGGDIQIPTAPRKTYFESFSSWVDGKPVETALKVAESNADEQFYKQWWTKSVVFEAGQTRRVRNEYVTQYGSNTMSIDWLTYVLGTGRTWAGTIGSAKVVADISGVPKGSFVVSNPKYHRRSGNKIVWEFRDFEPEELTFEVSIGRVRTVRAWEPKAGTETAGVGYVFRR